MTDEQSAKVDVAPVSPEQYNEVAGAARLGVLRVVKAAFFVHPTYYQSSGEARLAFDGTAKSVRYDPEDGNVSGVFARGRRWAPHTRWWCWDAPLGAPLGRLP